MTELILDGQQRLTALWRALNQDYPDHEYFIDIRHIDADEDGETDFRVIPQARWSRNGQRYPVWCDDPKQVLRAGSGPRPPPASRRRQSVAGLARRRHRGGPVEAMGPHAGRQDLRERVSHFNLPFLALPVEASEAVVLNVFVKMNTRSVPLTAFDIIVARVEGETGESLHDLVASLEGQVPGLNRYVARKIWCCRQRPCSKGVAQRSANSCSWTSSE